MKALVATALWVTAAFGGACNRPDSPPPPVVPVQPQPPAAPPQASAPTVAPIPKDVPLPAPKAAPAHPQPDAPESAAAAPAVAPDAPQGSKPAATVREIHPAEGSAGCVEMYGTCTPPPDRLCTSSALYVDCGKRVQVPGSGDWVNCVCP